MTWWDNLKAVFDGRPVPRRDRSAPAPIVWTTNAAGTPGRPSGEAAFPRFYSTAGDQFDTRGADRFAASRIKLRGAYTPAQPIIDRRMFAGRTRVLTQLIRSLEDERLHTVIYGERGLGKTSLLHVLTQAARDARYLVVYVTCGAGSNFDDMMRTVAENIPLLYHVDYGPTTAEAERGDSFASLVGADAITVRGASDLLGRVTGTRVLVVLDEFDRADSIDFRRSIAELVKSLSDRSVRVQFVIAGVAANLNELVTNVPAIQRSISALQVPKMSAGEVRELIKKGEPITGITFDDGAIQGIVSRSIGFPFLASLLSHRAGLNAIDRGADTVTYEDVAAATSDSVDDAYARLSRRSQLDIKKRLDAGALPALGALAGVAQSVGGRFTFEDITALHADPAAIAAARALLDRLGKDDVLLETIEDEFGKTYAFRDFSTPIYLWLLAARDKSARTPTPLREPEHHS
jgi:Cdc6-like AAA superfamily ATPase